MNRLIFISMCAAILASCGPSVNLNKAGGETAYSACLKAVRSVAPSFSDNEFMIVQIFDSAKSDEKSLKESRFFTYPSPPEGGATPSAVCVVDIRAKKIIKLSKEKQSIVADVSEELRAF